jgi:hypothetical protein
MIIPMPWLNSLNKLPLKLDPPMANAGCECL